MKTTAEIRSDFLDFFADRDHKVVASASLVPGNDPTLLFTNAGMVPFKDVFLGAEKRPYRRATSSQKCVRAGGKHNDLDQVGYTARHHTFFEMLGNFSFGDYFKADAIRFAWNLLTEVYGLPEDRLLVTVYEDDDEAYDLWRNEVGIAEDRLIRIGDKPGGEKFDSDNFWAMGETGPCGPCTEVFYDHGADIPGGPPGSPEEEGDRFVEIWNLVFMQYDRAADGKMTPLPKPCVDTGMGLERIAAVLQGVHSNYEIDLFRALIRAAAEATGCEDLDHASLKVIADHIRACAFLIVDGVLPANDGRGYVLRRIIRRAVRHGFKLGQKEPFFHRMVGSLVDQMGEAYPDLAKAAGRVEQHLLDEERRFARTLDTGLGILNDVMDQSEGVIDGDTAFLLYDTYGFPLDLTEDVARERGLTVDREGFDAAMQQQRERARSAGKFKQSDAISAEAAQSLPATEFLGYEATEAAGVQVVGLLVDSDPVDELSEGQAGMVVLDRTPFYAESGGQVGDTGVLKGDGVRFDVEDTVKLGGTFHGHFGRVKNGTLRVGQSLDAAIDADRRRAIVLHHSATHLLHAALRELLGDHVEQKGSLVAEDHLRFDFSHPEALTAEQKAAIERWVNDAIRDNLAAEIAIMPFDEAVKTGAVALFGEKYGDEVRVLRYGDRSVELCGGTHVDRLGDIGQFKITEESSIASGVRRIVGVAGAEAVARVQAIESRLGEIAAVLHVSGEKANERVLQLMQRNRELEKELEGLRAQVALAGGNDLASRAVKLDGVKVLSARLEAADARTLRDSVDRLKDQLGDSVIVLGSTDGDKVRLAAGVSQNLTSRLKAGDLVNFVATQVGGKGGGRPDFAQAGGNDARGLDKALETVTDWVSERIE